MLERKRAARSYQAVPGEEDHDELDVELGEGVGSQEQETGIIYSAGPDPNVTEELDNWDENAEDWDDDDVAGAVGGDAEGHKTPTNEATDNKRRTD